MLSRWLVDMRPDQRLAHLPELQGIFEIGGRCAYLHLSLINVVNAKSINLVICT